MKHDPEQHGGRSAEEREHLRIQSILVPASDGEALRQAEIDPNSLTEYQRAVGGYIEAVGLRQPPATMYVNEEGKLEGLPVNRAATLLLWMHSPAFRYADVVVGDALITGLPNADGVDTNVPAELLHTLFQARQFRPEVRVYGENRWHTNQQRFSTWPDAYAYVLDLGQRWTSVEDVRVVPEA